MPDISDERGEEHPEVDNNVTEKGAECGNECEEN
jgi:hypothetical protein